MRAFPTALGRFKRRSHKGVLSRFAVKSKLWLIRFAAVSSNTRAAHEFIGVFSFIFAHLLSLLKLVFTGISFLFFKLVSLIELLANKIEHIIKHISKWFLIASNAILTVRYKHKQREHGRLVALLFLLSAVIVICSATYYNTGLEVTLYGKSVGFVQSRSELEAIIEDVEDTCSQYLGRPYSLQVDVNYELGFFDKARMIDQDIVRELIFSEVNEITTQYVLMVDGKIVGANDNRTSLELMLRRLKAQAADSANVKTEFKQEVKIEQRNVATMQAKSISEIEQILTSNVQEDILHTVRGGDTISAIAMQYGTSVSSITSLNPDIKPEKIQVGDIIKVSGSVPFLSLQQTKTEYYTETIPYETTIEYVDNLYTNQSRISVEGVYGQANVVADVTYIDGKEASRTILSYQIVSQPRTAVKQVGTKKLPPKAATGSFVKPSNGVFSSGYGYRKSLGDFHTGVDFAGATGTNIWASDGGTVTFAGRKGNYGLLVIVSHGNGYQTYYAHCSKLLVKVGQKVAKREVIAKVGNTGRSYGSHVHFEIRKNGVTQNPLSYISK